MAFNAYLDGILPLLALGQSPGSKRRGYSIALGKKRKEKRKKKERDGHIGGTMSERPHSSTAANAKHFIHVE